jgi:transposase
VALGRIPRSRIALETGTHSPWVSRLLSKLGHEVIVAHARRMAARSFCMELRMLEGKPS